MAHHPTTQPSSSIWAGSSTSTLVGNCRTAARRSQVSRCSALHAMMGMTYWTFPTCPHIPPIRTQTSSFAGSGRWRGRRCSRREKAMMWQQQPFGPAAEIEIPLIGSQFRYSACWTSPAATRRIECSGMAYARKVEAIAPTRCIHS